MTPRIDAEVEMVREHFPDLEYDRERMWILIPEYGKFDGWTPSPMSVAFQISPSHPVTKPYGFYTPASVRYRGDMPKNFKPKPKTKVPFDGDWGFFSWTPERWEPAAEIHHGSNLFNWAVSFVQRFREGR